MVQTQFISFYELRYLYFTLFSVLLSCAVLSQPLVTTPLIIQETGIVSLHSNDVFTARVATRHVTDKPLPVSSYSNEQIKVQRKINDAHNEAVVTELNTTPSNQWTEIDRDEITPYTWQWVCLELINKDSTHSTMSLRRPTWWIKKNGADHVGNKVFIDIDEFGIEGEATVIKLYPNQIDTRVWNEDRKGKYGKQPIIGKYVHESAHVFNLYWDTGEKVGVTANHSIWSFDRQCWVEAAHLSLGEYIETYGGKVKLIRKERLPGKHTVYNIEVYRTHNYFASTASAKVHNGPVCGIDFNNKYWNGMIEKAIENIENITGNYRATISYEKVGEEFNMLLFTIQRRKGTEKAAGQLTDAMEHLVETAKKSGATKINFVVSTVLNDDMKGYFSSFDKKFKGFKMTTDGKSFGFTGVLQEIERIPPDVK